MKRSVLFRVSGLAEAAQRLASAVAVLGGPVELREAAALAALDPSIAAVAADTLTEGGVFVAGPRLTFVHPLVREVCTTRSPHTNAATDTGARRMCSQAWAPGTTA